MVCCQQSTLVFNQIFVKGKIDSEFVNEGTRLRTWGGGDFPRGYLIFKEDVEDVSRRRKRERRVLALFLPFKILSDQLSFRRFIWKEAEAFAFFPIYIVV